MRAFISCDDLWRREQIDEYLVPLREAIPHLKVTAYGIPNYLGPIHDINEMYGSWLTVAVHGFCHTRSECLSWTDDLAAARIEAALKMGFFPGFKAPNFALYEDTEIACNALNVILHHDLSYIPKHISTRAYPGRAQRDDHTLITCHLQNYSGSQDFIGTNGRMTPDYLKQFDTFLTLSELV